MSRHGEELLLKIFRRWEADPAAGAPASIPITRSSALPYFQAEGIDDKDALHAYLRIAEREECNQSGADTADPPQHWAGAI